MNTDNAHVGGLTIDYGPCAFMDGFHPDRVFSSIDRGGRYAYANQPQIAVWNMAQLAGCLLPLIDADENRAVAAATEVVHGFAPAYESAWLDRFRAKLGLATAQDGDADLVERLLALMAGEGADFTRTFRGLAEGTATDEVVDRDALAAWTAAWQARLAAEGRDEPTARAAMRRANPAVIPRNHRIEQVIRAAVAGDLAPFHALHTALADPWEGSAASAADRAAPAEDQRVLRTFCGT
jgi:uncharacterized protein YdiU (UPF0061 family)